MLFGRSRSRTGYDPRSWPVLLLLSVVVAIPTLGALWFMNRAMGNETLAVRQKLSDAYRAQLGGVQRALQERWRVRAAALDLRGPSSNPADEFARRVRDDLADSVVIVGGDDTLGYPEAARPAETDRSPVGWRRAERLEAAGEMIEAADAYRRIAEASEDRDRIARALQARARCLVRAEQTADAIEVLVSDLGADPLVSARDPQGRSIVANGLLLALHLIDDPSDARHTLVANRLAEHLNDYQRAGVPAPQRRFLMAELTRLAPDVAAFDTLAAETLAKRYLDSRPIAPSRAALQPSGLPDLWHLASPSGTVVGLFEQRRLLEDLDSSTVRRGLPPATSLELLPPGVEPTGSFLVSMPAGGLLQDWSLVLRPEDQALFATAARQQNTATALTGVLVVAVILVLTVLMARVVDRKLRLTRLKNDLLSTVSHELKTPLASMRLLVDTLIDNGVDDRARVREYLHLIAQENSRLSRLVDNFLTFSRLEQQRQHFDREPVAPADVVADAANSVGERFRAAGCRFDVEVEDDLPLVLGDHDALVTVLLNLLDNAFKYSDEDEQRILLCAHRDGNQIGFAVRDHGIGLSRRASGKIFERFYQVDQSLSRPGSGCGLGLSIVRLIVRAHHGTIDVESRLGVGSTFTVRLPATAAIRTTDREDDA